MEAKIQLREHQEPMAERIDNLYANEKNFAGVVLATGGGKSFIAMDQIIKFADNYNLENPLNQEEQRKIPKVFSNVPIYYFSPTNIILYQFKLHMAQNIIVPEYIVDYERNNGAIKDGLEIEIAKTVLSQMDSKIKIDDINFEGLLSEVKVEGAKSEEVIQKLVRVALEQIPSNQVEKIVEEAFPNINFTTYQALEQASDKEISQMEAKFIIFDEAHRAGAEKWWPKVQKIIKNTRAKVIAITATPERDVDEKDMMRDLALLPESGYTLREVRKKEYYAGNMPLLKAIEGGHITPPEVVHFNCKLDETPEFEEAVKTYVKFFIKKENATSGKSRENSMNSHSMIQSSLKQMIILTRLDPLIDYDETLTEDAKKTRKIEDRKNVETIVEKRGKYGEKSSGIIPEMDEAILNGMKQKLSEEEIFNLCMEKLRNPEWEEQKKQRVSTIISKEVKSRGIEEGKAINFIEAMENSTSKKETKEEKIERAKEHIANKINELKLLFNEEIMKMPEITAVHSLAFKSSENNEILNRFMQKVSDGRMKIIAAVNKFNEGFHPDGIRALFMTKPIEQNAKKESEPRIVLLQQIGRCLSAGKKEPSVIFDIACNFMRNREKFKTESEKECFSFLGLSKEETEFLRHAKTISNEKKKASEVRPDTDKLIKILEVLNKKGVQVNSKTIEENMNLGSFINSILDENLRETVLDELFLKEIELETDSNFNIGTAYRYARNVYLGEVSDSTELKKLSKIQLPEMLKLGIIETQTEEGRKSLEGRINKAGFIVRGIVPSTFAYNVYTGTKFDSPDTDVDRKDYYGCGPDGRDPAGFDRFGFDANGIHRITGRTYNERHFTPEKREDGSVSWVYVNPQTGEKKETDPLGFNYEGIDPKTGFDRNGYWHKREEDGTFSIVKSRLNDEKMDSHGFFFKSITEKLGLYRGDKMRFKNERGLYSNGSIWQNGIGKESDRYGLDEHDIDGFDRNGFAKNKIHRDTSTEYGLDGKDSSGELQHDLKITAEIMSLLKTGKIKASELPRRLGIDSQEIDKVISSAYSISRTLDGIVREKNKSGSSQKGKDVIEILNMTKNNPKAVDELFKLSPSMRKQVERELLANRAMNKFCSSRIDKILRDLNKGHDLQNIQDMQDKMRIGNELREVENNLQDNIGSVPFRKPEEDDFIL